MPDITICTFLMDYINLEMPTSREKANVNNDIQKLSRIWQSMSCMWHYNLKPLKYSKNGWKVEHNPFKTITVYFYFTHFILYMYRFCSATDCFNWLYYGILIHINSIIFKYGEEILKYMIYVYALYLKHSTIHLNCFKFNSSKLYWI